MPGNKVPIQTANLLYTCKALRSLVSHLDFFAYNASSLKREKEHCSGAEGRGQTKNTTTVAMLINKNINP